jgi:hypothetical protein
MNLLCCFGFHQRKDLIRVDVGACEPDFRLHPSPWRFMAAAWRWDMRFRNVGEICSRCRSRFYR